MDLLSCFVFQKLVCPFRSLSLFLSPMTPRGKMIKSIVKCCLATISIGLLKLLKKKKKESGYFCLIHNDIGGTPN